jgi:hypothetical protein
VSKWTCLVHVCEVYTLFSARAQKDGNGVQTDFMMLFLIDFVSRKIRGKAESVFSKLFCSYAPCRTTLLLLLLLLLISFFLRTWRIEFRRLLMYTKPITSQRSCARFVRVYSFVLCSIIFSLLKQTLGSMKEIRARRTRKRCLVKICKSQLVTFRAHLHLLFFINLHTCDVHMHICYG